MRKGFILAAAMISAFILFSANTFADSFNISWDNDRHDDREPAEVHESGNSPPDHAPAHGYRAKHRYQYYPSASVYHDAGRGLYFYLSGSNWQVSASLPLEFRARLGGPVSLELETDKPYIHYDQHRRQYPPGKAKKADKHKGGKKKKK
jgi:hypothetical protein